PSNVTEPDRLGASRLGDPPSNARGRESPPPDTLHRSRGRGRDHATRRCTPPALRSQMHLRESPNRQARHRQRHRERLTRAVRGVARAAQAAPTAPKTRPTPCPPPPPRP